ncbi:MAG: FprA family A-type flavoprotein [Barnesiella sp.]
MMEITEFVKNIHYVGVNDRVKQKFEGLWPLPNGVSYNSYLITDEKTALIDTVDLCYGERFLAKIQAILGDKPIDYLIINHMEPDHSASISLIRQVYPKMKIVGNAKTLSMIEGFYGICDYFMEIKDGDVLPLGKKKLRFYLTPMVHWPETMMTYCENDALLFSGDAFGCFGAVDGGVTDEQMNTDRYWSEMYRYYSNIVGKYGSPVQKALAKLAEVKIETICSTHGPVWQKNVEKVISIYDKLSRYEAEEGVVIAYGSMYGNTEQMAEEIARELAAQGIKNIVMYNLSFTDPSYVLSDIFRYKGLIIGGPTYSNQLFPPVEALTRMIEVRDIKNRIFGYFGSFTWAGASVRRLGTFAETMKWTNVCSPVEMKQGITPDKTAECCSLARNFATLLKG